MKVYKKIILVAALAAVVVVPVGIFAASSSSTLLDQVFDLIWKNMFHYTTFFESLDGWGQIGTGSAELSGSYVAISSGQTSGDEFLLRKTPSYQGVITFSQKSAFKTSFAVPSATTNMNSYIVVGSVSKSFYGFEIKDGSLYGVTSADGRENQKAVLLQTISSGDVYNIEARYTPNSNVVFYVNTVKKATITSTANLPNYVSSAGVAVPNFSLVNVTIKTTDNTAKSIDMSYFDYLQTRSAIE